LARPRKTERDFEITEKVIDAAEKLFAKQGFVGTSLKQIAEKAGIQAPSLLYHFGSKEVLYEHVLERFYDEIDDMLFVDADEADHQVYFQKLFQKFISMSPRQKNLSILFMQELIGAGALGEKVIARRMLPLLEKAEQAFRNAQNNKIPEHAPVKEVIVQLLLSLVVKESLGKTGQLFLGNDKVFSDVLAHHVQSLKDW